MFEMELFILLWQISLFAAASLCSSPRINMPQCHRCFLSFLPLPHPPYKSKCSFNGLFKRNNYPMLLLWGTHDTASISGSFLFFFDKFIYYFWLLGLCCCARAFSRCRERGLLSLQCMGFSLRWHLLLRSTCSRACGLQ